MREVDILEAKWKIYKYRQFAPYLIIIIVLIVCFIYFFSVDNVKQKDPVGFQILHNHTIVDKRLVDSKMPLVIYGSLNILEPEIVHDQLLEKICIKRPSLDYTQTFIENNITATKKESIDNEKIEQTKSYTKSNKKSVDDVCLSLPAMKIDDKPTKSKRIKFDVVENVDALSDIMRRFNQSKDPNDALFLANNFYESGDYSKALYWAIETNKITEDIEDGWLLMAKSKAKLGDRGEAVRILKAYSTKKMSKEALDLASQIESGEWK